MLKIDGHYWRTSPSMTTKVETTQGTSLSQSRQSLCLKMSRVHLTVILSSCFMEAHLAPKQLVQVNKITSSCKICSGPYDTQYNMENPEQAFVDYASSRNNKLEDTSTRDTEGDSMAYVNATSTDQIKKEELQRKGIKIPLKLLSLKYLSRASLEEQNRNSSSSKHVHFINFFVILRKEDEVREEENVKPNATEYNDHQMIDKVEEKIEEESEDEFEE
uniref:MAK10-like protein n=1 Tax=Tanacetum cinerariifolium TaxID=118510 RepID=A0A699Q8I5_TANCI|nr:MAK10-like protein [Tanacetum cinerariifolium]